jgi:signal transduction histidine kinase
MRRFRLLFLVFSLAIIAPVALLVDRALRSVALEREMRHQALAERVFDEMERALSRLLEREEGRPFERYVEEHEAPAFPFVVGHFQVDPDGRVRALPALHANERAAGKGGGELSRERQAATAEIERAVGSDWRAGGESKNVRESGVSQLPGTTVELGAGGRPAAVRGQLESRDEPAAKSEVSAFDALRFLNKGVQERVERQRRAAEYGRLDDASMLKSKKEADSRSAPPEREEVFDSARSQIDSTPLNGRVIDGRHLLLHRTVVREMRAYRQGVLLDVERLGEWLRAEGLGGDGLAAYADVAFATRPARPPLGAPESAFVYQHRFAEPFADLTASLALQPLPGVGSVTYVYALSALLLATGILGLAALYRMVSVVVSFAERRSNFVAAVSHELKTPLTAIRMYGEMLRDGMVPSEAKRDEYHRHITVESERLSRLINNVLEFSRLEKGNREMALVVGPVAPVVGEVAELLRPHVEAEGFALGLEVDADLPPVRFERDALMQVLWNLADNAVKYAREAPRKEIVLSCRRDGGGATVAVRDHGPGVPPRHLGRIFEPFYRGENELTRRNKGTGLGLALVRGLVERMGARVTGRNMPGGGFEVEIAFPAVRRE